MPKKPGKAKGLSRARTRPAGKKAKGRPFDPGPDMDAEITDRDATTVPGPDPNRLEKGKYTFKEKIWVKSQESPDVPSDPALPWNPSSTRSVMKKAARHRDIVAIGACEIAAGMLANFELIDDLDQQDVVKRIITMSIFIAREIHQGV